MAETILAVRCDSCRSKLAEVVNLESGSVFTDGTHTYTRPFDVARVSGCRHGHHATNQTRRPTVLISGEAVSGAIGQGHDSLSWSADDAATERSRFADSFTWD